ncbi:unnamed protein product [Candidula unifasciata]|uniref:Ribosomal protein L3 n=1 Tax=Candidula unifasciata TaxID=100452 RepID=A0A8S3ZF35_9EUPU|nr:unnamed protein product [Candidula unifasciata]
MSHGKCSAPRHGSEGFLPKERSKRLRSKVKAFPKDDKSKPMNLTAFIGYKAGMTHIVREIDRPGSKTNKKEVVEVVTIIDGPPMVFVGVVGYIETPTGLRTLRTVFAADETGKKAINTDLKKIKKENFTPLRRFPNYGEVRNDYIKLRGCCSLMTSFRRRLMEKITLKFIDTSSKWGRFQIPEEKRAFIDTLKKELLFKEAPAASF